MTLRDFYVAVAEANVNDELTAKATDLVEKLDASNEKKRAKAAEKRLANTENVDKLVGVLTDEFQTSTMIMEKLDGVIERADGKDLTKQYISRLAKTGIELGKIVKGDVKVEGVRGTHIGYKLA